MMMNQPNRFDFLTHYRGNALSPIVLQLKYRTGQPIDLTGSTIRMELKRPLQSRATFVFSSENDGDGLFNILDALEGKIQFPEIKSWGIPADNYTYDLVICDADGNSRCYLRGNWRVTQNISKIPCSDVSGGYSSNYSGFGVVCHSQDVEINGQTYEVEVIVIEVDYQERGENGHTPYIVDGNWWINGVDTGFPSTGADGKDGTDGVDGQDGITTNLNPESPNSTLRMWEGTRNQYDEQQPLADDVITFIREL